MLEASMIAGYILGEGALTMVAPGRECASACVLLLLAGKRRLVADTASIGVHGAAMPDGTENDAALAATTESARLFAHLGMPPDIVGRVVMTPPGSMYWLSADELARMGVSVMPPPPP